MELTEALKTVFRDTAASLTGSARRVFMARVVKHLGPGGQRRAEGELGWCRVTIREGLHEVTSGVTRVDAVTARGRQRAEGHSPTLLTDIRAIVDGQSQADPRFRTQRLSARLSAAEIRRHLILQEGYTDAALPTEETIRVKVNALGYTLTTVAKTQPQKRSPRRMPSSSRWRSSTLRPTRPRGCSACRWTPRRPSRSAPSVGGA